MLAECIDIPKRSTIAQKVVFTLSRIGVSPREVRDIVDYIRIINSHGLAEDDIPSEKKFIFRELAKDGVIKMYVTRGESHYKPI